MTGLKDIVLYICSEGGGRQGQARGRSVDARIRGGWVGGEANGKEMEGREWMNEKYAGGRKKR